MEDHQDKNFGKWIPGIFDIHYFITSYLTPSWILKLGNSLSLDVTETIATERDEFSNVLLYYSDWLNADFPNEKAQRRRWSYIKPTIDKYYTALFTIILHFAVFGFTLAAVFEGLFVFVIASFLERWCTTLQEWREENVSVSIHLHREIKISISDQIVA